AGSVFIGIAIALGGDVGLFVDAPSVLIVGGGTLATMFIRYPLRSLFTVFTVVKNVFFTTPRDQSEVITQFIQLSQIARKEGLLALERVQFEDPFLAKGINYCVDGAEGHQIESILMKEIQFLKARHQAGQDMLKAINQSAPAFGMIGTLIGLVNMLANMDDPKSIGPAMAVAILTTLYGAVAANLFATPMADKLALYSSREVDLKLLMVEGILGLKRGENPRMLEETLHTFLSPADREALKSAS
ncbi:MAG: MotA/TolQ/ExbB proton channel family protein, partial [Myxococcales bacterium]|nr:MotA/TolQ/ExbB proton channel family protein [Myxococcales bacterium]